MLSLYAVLKSLHTNLSTVSEQYLSHDITIFSLLDQLLYWNNFVASMDVIDISWSGPRLNIKTVLSTYGDFHVKDKTAVRTSYL